MNFSTSKAKVIELAIMARTPELGRVKKRLAATIGDNMAFNVYVELLEKIVQTTTFAVKKMPVLKPVIWYLGPVSDNILKYCHNFELRPQPADNFQNNLDIAFSQINKSNIDAVIVVAADAPTIGVSDIIDLAMGLSKCQVSVGPSPDGGFWGMGSRVDLNNIFSKIPLGNSRVYTTLINQIELLGYKMAKCKSIQDIDTEIDLKHWRSLQKN